MSATSLQSAMLSAIVEASIVDVAGTRAAHIQVAAVLDALSLVTASMIATAPEAASAEGIKRVLRRQARRLEKQVAEFRRHAARHGSPFAVRP